MRTCGFGFCHFSYAWVVGFVLLQRGEDSSSWVRISRFKVAILGVDLVFWVLGFGFGACGGSILSWDFEV